MTGKFLIDLGTHGGGQSVKLDARTLVDTRMLIAGSSGSGKSYAMRVIAEQTAPKVQTIVIDPEGEYTTLREKCDMVIVGREGEVVPTVPTAGKLARRLLELEVSAVVDLYDLKIGERRSFVRRFLESLMNLPKKLWHPTIIMIDEAHKMCPERSSGQAESTDAVITLLSQGRKRGYCGILSTQRLQKLHKDAAAETLNNLIGRTSLDTDVRRAREILGVAKADEARLRALKPGNWYGFGPAFHDIDGVCQFKARKATTSHPEPGKRHKLRAPAPSARIKRVLPELSELPQEVEQEANDLAAAKAQISELQKELRKLQRANRVSEPSSVDVEAAAIRIVAKHSRAVEKEYKRQFQTVHATLRSVMAEGKREIEATISQMSRSASAALSGVDVRVSEPEVTPKATTHRSRKSPARVRTPPINGARSESQLGGGMRRIMVAVAATGGATRTEVAIISHMTPGSGTYSTYLGRLRTAGYIAQDGCNLVATEAGLQALGEYEEIPIGGWDLVESWAPELGYGGIRRLFDALAEAGMEGLSRDALAEQAGLEPSSGTYSTYLGKLRKKGLTVDRWPLRLHGIFFWEDHG